MEFLTKNSLNLNSGREIIAKNFANWSSGNKIIDNLIQEKQLKYDKYDVVFEWIPYIKLIDIREIGNNGLATAIWKEGLLHYCRHEWIRIPYEKVALRFLYDSQNISDEFINEVKSYDSLLFEGILDSNYGLSQNPETKDYILIFSQEYFKLCCGKCGKKYENRQNRRNEWCKTCQINHLKNNFTNWTSGNEKIDDFIQKMQLKINKFNDAIFEWIPYNE
ncbi:hypothetical protein GLOIN_2v103127 [Rhizophagus irregularis DAOM 181602=DAOM 197198]|uniref:Uncharacterized protein n=1 Tax=Rhizophagus irregularis (strain DAOM 181602 / DAOM 197198 / MUCL 43194) TaxID=747089 RepID=A0A2P4PZ23_RHIID|nr:hypothetical protein GLOIN_2v103127 [Rhizophagus irregularis DAOM 181602=DAOM 197198]POG70634.1 hypothetical protein GLOIN_2v103127 [Rhizophagus irregularis DAOM 181602=DAOM 197198]|eukprot:XP_025177500.1 hypothetical protein GLOIN_2v103127 [Rhizophagus irregularis DAOM 181602=DAOM 197198]